MVFVVVSLLLNPLSACWDGWLWRTRRHRAHILNEVDRRVGFARLVGKGDVVRGVGVEG